MTEKHVPIGCKHAMLGNQTYEVLLPLSKLSRQSLKLFEFVDMFSINKYGQNFKPGIPLSKDFRNEMIQMAATRPISEICERYRINRSTVHKYTKQYCKTGNIEPLSRKHIRTQSKLLFGDSMLLETIVQRRGSTSLKEIKSELSCHFLLYQDMFAKTCQAVKTTGVSGWGSVPVKGLHTAFLRLLVR